MNLEEAKKLFDENVKSKEIRDHCLEVSKIMRFLAEVEGEDVEKWEIVGLLHDLDYDDEKYKILEKHTQKTVEILKDKVEEDVIKCILSHNEEQTRVKRESKMDYSLSASDNVSGLIYAYGLMRGGISGMTAGKLKKKMKEKAFAAAVRRDLIYDVSKVIELDKFLEVSIKAMESISGEISL